MPKYRLPSRLLVLFLVLAGALPLQAASADLRPLHRAALITGDAAGPVLVARVRKGTHRVVLQSRSADGWKIRAVAHVDGTKRTVKFRIPDGVKRTDLRVLASETDTLPASYFKGKQNFSRRTAVRPDAGAQSQALRSSSGLMAAAGVSATDSVAGAERTVSEPDICRVRGTTLYFFNQYRGLQVIDISNPAVPVIKKRLRMPAVGEDLYVLDDNHVVLLTHKGSSWNESEVIAVALDSAEPAITARFTVDGWIDASRMVGSALYLSTNGWHENVGTSEWGTLVSSFDFSAPAAPLARDSIWLSGYGSTSTATDSYFLVIGSTPGDWSRNIVHTFDITNPNGTMVPRGSIAAAGYLADKFKVNVSGTVLTTVSQVWATGGNVGRSSVVETFSMANPDVPVKLGDVTVGKGEQLFGTRFDGNLAYIVTFASIDPLWIVDLSNPAAPAVAGHVEVPGYSTFLQPMGTRLLTLGVEGGKVAVSLFDVANPAAPALLSRVTMGGDFSWSEALFDEKAFTVLRDAGMILLPVSSYDSTTGRAQGTQIIDMDSSSLTKRGTIAHSFQPRRALAVGNQIFSISGRELLSVAAGDWDNPVPVADLELAWPVDRVFVQGDYLIQIEDGNDWDVDSLPVLRVSSAGNPDEVLSATEIDGPGIRGATVRGGKLYLAQATPDEPVYWLAKASGTDSQTATLAVSSWDLSALPDVTLIGAVEQKIESLGWNPELKALWPADHTLAWIGTTQNFWPIYMDAQPVLALSSNVPVSGAVSGVGSLSSLGAVSSVADAASNSGALRAIRPWWRGGSSGLRLFLFDVAGDAPQFLAAENLTTDAWQTGETFVGENVLFSSHMGSWKARDEWQWLERTGSSDVTGWAQGWRLDVIDLTDPSQPKVHESASLPSELIGVANARLDGGILFTMGDRVDESFNSSGYFLTASAFDGASAWQIDSQKITGWPSGAVVEGTNLYVAVTPADDSIAGEIQSWSFSGAGKLVAVTSTPLDESPWGLRLFDDLLAARTNAGITVLDLKTPGVPGAAVSMETAAWFTLDLSRACGDSKSGLWVAEGDYGVDAIPTPVTP